MHLITEELTRSIKSEDDMGGMKLIGLNIQSIPPEAVELIRESVERLSLQNNNISNLPQYFNRLSKLRYLDIHDNQFSAFPDILTTMSELEILDISFNNLRSLPNDLGHLKNLKVLSLKNNNFEILPTSILSIKNLKILEIENNPLKLPSQSFINNIPHKIHSQEWLQEIKNYLVYNKDLIQSNLLEIDPLYNGNTPITTTSSSTTTPIKETEKPPLTSSQSHIQQQHSSLSSTGPHSSSVQHLERSRSTSESYVSSRAAKRMGFIVKRPNPESTPETVKEVEPPVEPLAITRRNRSMSAASSVSSSPNQQTIEEEQETIGKDTKMQIPNGGYSPMNSEKLDSIPEHRSNDYFKRLSTLPEQRPSLNQYKIVDVSRKVLFSITEFQATIKKLNAFCSEKHIIVEMVSQLYSSKSIIDRLVESLETTEENDDGYVSVDEILQSVSQTVSIFKKMIDILQSNYYSYVKNADVCFIRALLLSLFLSYGEVCNAYRILNPRSQTPQRPPKDIYSNNHITNAPRTGTSQLPPLKVNDLGMNPTITQQQLNEYSEADQKLYESLHNALESSSQVYAELNGAISKSAIANAVKPAEEQQQHLNETTISKIKELTNTCVVSMDLNRKIKTKLGTNNIKTTSLVEKKKFFDEINALLKSIITILGSTKSIMNEMPILNEVRPSLASLTKATKDVTIMLEVSSYILINDSFSSLNSAVPQSATSMQAPMLSSIPSVMSIPQMNTPFLPNMPTTVHTPVSQPNANPFEATLGSTLQHDENLDTLK